jgi:hypothetical protein
LKIAENDSYMGNTDKTHVKDTKNGAKDVVCKGLLRAAGERSVKKLRGEKYHFEYKKTKVFHQKLGPPTLSRKKGRPPHPFDPP